MQKNAKLPKNIAVECEIYDYFDAQSDLENREIKCVGNASLRFSEDALRILRAIRFAATLPYHFRIESSTKDAIFKLQNLLAFISKERINSEISRLLLGENASEILIEFKEIFVSLMPFLGELTSQKYALNCKALKFAPKNLEIKICLLFHFLPLDSKICLSKVQKTLKALKFSRKTIINVSAILSLECLDAISSDKIALKKLLSKYEKYPHGNVILNWLLMRKALCFENLDSKAKIENAINLYDEITLNNECFYLSHLAVNGKDIVRVFKHLKCEYKGAEIGEILNFLLLQVIENKCENTKTELLALAKAYIKAGKGYGF